MAAAAQEITLYVNFKGSTQEVNLLDSSSARQLLEALERTFGVPGFVFKLMHKGKKVMLDAPTAAQSVASTTLKELGLKNKSKIMALGTPGAVVQAELTSTKKPDPTIRSLEDEEKWLASKKEVTDKAHASIWGTEQDNSYKFCRFGSLKRFEGQVPHPFAARQLLHTLATDPGVIEVMRANELVVGLLEEMDPDDRLAAITAKQRGGCLLGYNSGGGATIHLRLRSDDGLSFRPYADLIDTLLHELAHNIAGPHLRLFWQTFARFKGTYLQVHMDRARFPLRFPRARPGAPVPETAKDVAGITTHVRGKLMNEATANGALSADERSAASAAAQDVVALAPLLQNLSIAAQAQASPPVQRTEQERRELRQKQADVLEQRLKRQAHPNAKDHGNGNSTTNSGGSSSKEQQ